MDDTEANWKPEQILSRYIGAIECAAVRGELDTKESLKKAFLCAYKRAVYRFALKTGRTAEYYELYGRY